MDPDPEGDKEGEGGVGGKEWIGNADNASEKDAVWSFVCFSSEKETKEPYKQGYLGIYYYVETRSYSMIGPRAPTFPVLGCRSAGKLASRPPSTTPMAPPRCPQDCGTMATIRVVVGVREGNFP